MAFVKDNINNVLNETREIIRDNIDYYENIQSNVSSQKNRCIVILDSSEDSSFSSSMIPSHVKEITELCFSYYVPYLINFYTFKIPFCETIPSIKGCKTSLKDAINKECLKLRDMQPCHAQVGYYIIDFKIESDGFLAKIESYNEDFFELIDLIIQFFKKAESDLTQIENEINERLERCIEVEKQANQKSFDDFSDGSNVLNQFCYENNIVYRSISLMELHEAIDSSVFRSECFIDPSTLNHLNHLIEFHTVEDAAAVKLKFE